MSDEDDKSNPNPRESYRCSRLRETMMRRVWDCGQFYTSEEKKNTKQNAWEKNK